MTLMLMMQSLTSEDEDASETQDSNFKQNVRNHSKCGSIIIEILITHKEDTNAKR